MPGGNLYDEISHLASGDYDPMKHADGTKKTGPELLQFLDGLEASIRKTRRIMKTKKDGVRAQLQPYMDCDDPAVARYANVVFKRLCPWWRFW